VDDFILLFVKPPDLNQVAGVSAIICDELCHYCHGLKRIDNEIRATTIERLVAHAERINVTTIFVTKPW